jgi:hypothetical protein
MSSSPGVIEEGRGSVRRFRFPEEFLQRNDCGLVDAAGRALGCGIVGANRFDRVADEFEPDWLVRTGRIEIDDAAAHAEFARFVHRILSRVACRCEQISEVDRGDVLAWSQCQRRCGNPIRWTQPRKERARRRDDQARIASDEAVQRTCARAGDVEVGRKAAVRIDFVRWERQNVPLELRVRQSLEGRQEEPGVRRQRFNVGVCRHDDQRALAGSRCRSEHGARGRRQPRYPPARHTHPKACARLLQQRAECERTGCVGRHQRESLNC